MKHLQWGSIFDEVPTSLKNRLKYLRTGAFTKRCFSIRLSLERFQFCKDVKY